MSLKIVPKNNKNGDDEETLDSEDSFSDQSLESEEDAFENDGWIILEKKDEKKSFHKISCDYIKERKNIRNQCCRTMSEKIENFFHMKLRKKENQIRRLKMESKKKAKNINKM